MRSSFQEHADASGARTHKRSSQTSYVPAATSASRLASSVALEPNSPALKEKLATQLRAIIRARAERFDFFPETFFADPAWDILLELSLAEQEQRRVTLTQLYHTSHVPASTAARWIKALTDDGWLRRYDCTRDARVKYIELTDEASSKMRCYLLQTTDVRVI